MDAAMSFVQPLPTPLDSPYNSLDAKNSSLIISLLNPKSFIAEPVTTKGIINAITTNQQRIELIKQQFRRVKSLSSNSLDQSFDKYPQTPSRLRACYNLMEKNRRYVLKLRGLASCAIESVMQEND